MKEAVCVCLSRDEDPARASRARRQSGGRSMTADTQAMGNKATHGGESPWGGVRG